MSAYLRYWMILISLGFLNTDIRCIAESPELLFAEIAEPSPDASQSLQTASDDWYKDAVVYHLWVASFRDSDGNGTGDVRGIIESLDTLQQLGVNTIWLSPFFESASSNRNLHGYDVIDHYQVDARLGTNADIEELIREAHTKNMRLIFDFVPNHLSSRHPWFIESKDPASPKRDWFMWRDDRPESGWTGFDQQSDWHESDGDYYYGMFWGGMPDVNHRNAEVRLEMARAARYWLDKGFDGMRIDAIRYLYENTDGTGAKADQEDQPETIQWFKAWREQIIDPYTQAGYAKLIVAENWTTERESLESYLIHEGEPIFHMTLNFALLPALTKLDASQAEDIWQWSSTLPRSVGLGNFVSNHDLAADRPGSLFAGEPEKLRAQAAWLLLGPGTPFVYYGNEIGQAQGQQRGDTKHRQKLNWEELNDQMTDQDSIWSWHQRLIILRHAHASLRRGTSTFLEVLPSPVDVVAIWREVEEDATLTLFNGSSQPISDLKVVLPKTLNGRELRSLLRDESITADDDGSVRIGSLSPFETKLYSQNASQ